MSWNDKCAVFGIWNDSEAAWMTYLGLYAQQHRGQEGAGIVSLHERKHLIHRGSGLVGEVFSKSILKRLKGVSAIGHTRYSTRGKNEKRNVQPLTADLFSGPIAVAHNGNIVNFVNLKKELMNRGSIFYGTSDTECLIHLLANENQKGFSMALQKCLSRLEGAYSFVIMTSRSLTAVRDPMGFRPLVLGQRKNDKNRSWVVASETCAFDLIGAELVREIEPGEIWTVNLQGESHSMFLPKAASLHRCVFEYVYFARPDSQVFGRSVYETRKQMGKILATENPVQADLVMPVPESGVASAIGYSKSSHIPYEMGVIRNHYIGRTFIHPSQSIRDFRVKIKLSPQRALIKDKRIIVVDDSMVRGTTSKALVNMLRQAGSREIHFRIASPLIRDPCFYGVDTPQKSELIASEMNVSSIKEYLNVDSLAFLSHQGLMKAARGPEKGIKAGDFGFCSACFTGTYPTPLYKE